LALRDFEVLRFALRVALVAFRVLLRVAAAEAVFLVLGRFAFPRLLVLPPASRSFLGGRTSSGLLACASNGISDCTRSPRQSFCRSVHARFGGVSYRPQNAFFLFPCCSPPLRVFRVSVTPSLGRGLAHTDIAVQDRETQGEFRA